MKALCLAAHCPTCGHHVLSLPGSKHWQCVGNPTHHDKVQCPECETVFDPDGTVLSLEVIEAGPLCLKTGRAVSAA